MGFADNLSVKAAGLARCAVYQRQSADFLLNTVLGQLCHWRPSWRYPFIITLGNKLAEILATPEGPFQSDLTARGDGMISILREA